MVVVLAAQLPLLTAYAQPPSNGPLKPVRFEVIVDAPKPYEKMLQEGLDLIRWQKSEQVTLPLLRRLAAEAQLSASQALAADGYFTAIVTADVETTHSRTAVVRIKVVPGPRTRIGNVDLDFAGAAVDDVEGRKRIEIVKRAWTLVPGEPFRQSKWEEAKATALARLARGRYAAARVAESQARIIAEEQRADLRLKLDSGPIFHAGAVNVSGLKRYPPGVVQNLNPHREGEPYDATKLDLYQRRLLETGYFNAVNFTIDPDPDQSAAAPLNVNVIEAPSQRIDTGIAFSTDVGVGLTLDYGNADIFNSAWRFRSVLDINQKRQRANFMFDSPPRPGAVWDTYSASAERSDIEGQESREVMVGYAYNWGLERVPSQLSVSAHFERQSIEGSITQNNHAVYVAYRKSVRTTEELVSPRTGVIGMFEIGTSVPGLASQDFVRARAHVNWLIPAGLRNDFLVRGEVGTVIADSRRGIPSSFLFRTGGDQSIRGYAYQSIGVPEGEAIVGGRYVALGSVEYTRWITDTLGAAVFVDAGDAFDEASAFDLAVGYGIGGRWRSPIGPVRADVAYGKRTHKVRLHFSAGYQF